MVEVGKKQKDMTVSTPSSLDCSAYADYAKSSVAASSVVKPAVRFVVGLLIQYFQLVRKAGKGSSSSNQTAFKWVQVDSAAESFFLSREDMGEHTKVTNPNIQHVP